MGPNDQGRAFEKQCKGCKFHDTRKGVSATCTFAFRLDIDYTKTPPLCMTRREK